MHLTTCFGQTGKLPVTYSVYEILGRKLSAQSTVNRNTWCGNKETGLLLLLISGHVDDEEEGRALTRGLPSTVTQRFIHAHRLVWP